MSSSEEQLISKFGDECIESIPKNVRKEILGLYIQFTKKFTSGRTCLA